MSIIRTKRAKTGRQVDRQVELRLLFCAICHALPIVDKEQTFVYLFFFVTGKMLTRMLSAILLTR